MNSPSPPRDTSPLRFSWVRDCKQYPRASTSLEVRALKAHRNLTGFEARAISDWCEENVGKEDHQWGRTNMYGWWFRDEKWATQFLLVFQCSRPAQILLD